MANRSKAQGYILKYITAIAGNPNKSIYEKLFKDMSDEEFDKFIDDLDTGKKFLPVVAPNLGNVHLSVENNLKIAKEMNHDFFSKLWIGAHDGAPEYLTPIPYLVVDLPLRRVSQSLIKKVKVPTDNKTVDLLSGQPTGDGKSKGARISFPELQVLSAMGLDACTLELMKYRGGDRRGFRAMNSQISSQGIANLDTLAQYASGVESTKTLRTYLVCMHLKPTGL
jgi:hypothetical protein